jgi:hypothetical protein
MLADVLLCWLAWLVSISAAEEQHSLAGVHLRIVTVEDPPFIRVRDNPLGPIKPWNEWDGWVIEVIKRLSADSGFTYTLQLPTGGNTFAYGAADKDVSGVDMMYAGLDPDHVDLRSTLADDNGGRSPNVMFGGAYVTAKRLNATYVTTPFSTQPLSLLTDAPDPTFQSQAFTWVMPFEKNLWLAIAATAIFSGFFFVLIEGDNAASPDFGGEAFRSWYRLDLSITLSIYNAFSTTYGTTSFNPQSSIGYLFAGTWSFLCLVLVASYTAKLAVWLSFYIPVLDPTSFAAVAHENSLYTVCVLANSAYSNFLASSIAYQHVNQVPIKVSGRSSRAQCQHPHNI